jgi:hypothetical protein
MLPGGFIIISIAIRLISGGRYAWGVLHGKAQPNAVTWFLWGLTPLIAFFAGLQQGFNTQSFILLALAASPLVIFGITVYKTGLRTHLTPFALACGAIALAGIVLWKITDNPSLAIIFSIIADLFASLPTLRKAYKDPGSEYAFPYFLSAISMGIAILTIQDWTFTLYAFPVYMLCINIILMLFASMPIRQLGQKYGYSQEGVRIG